MGDAIANANEELVHGYTYSGHPVACAVALKNLEVIERDGLVPRVKNDIGPYLQRRLRETFEGHPLVGEVRGSGLLCAIELVRGQDERAASFPIPARSARIAATIASTTASSCAPSATRWCGAAVHDQRNGSRRTRRQGQGRHRPDGEGLREDVTGVAATRAIGSM